MPQAEKISFYHAREVQAGFYEGFIFILFILSTLGYTAGIFLILKRHERKIRESYSNPYWKDLHRLKSFLIGYNFILLLFILSPLIPYGWLGEKQHFVDCPAYIGLVVLIISAGYFGIRQTGIFTDYPAHSPLPVSK